MDRTIAIRAYACYFNNNKISNPKLRCALIWRSLNYFFERMLLEGESEKLPVNGERREALTTENTEGTERSNRYSLHLLAFSLSVSSVINAYLLPDLDGYHFGTAVKHRISQ